MEKRKYTVGGMTCAACSANVERAVRKVPGVERVAVSLLAGTMEVSGAADAQRVIEAVVKAGYTAQLFGEKAGISRAQADQDQLKSMKARLIASICFLAALMYVSMGHMIGLPLPEWLHGPGNEISFAFTQFLLALPVALINGKYFTHGFRALWHRSPNMDSLIAIGSSAAYLYGAAAIYLIGYGMGHNLPALVDQYSSQLYFESGAMILTLITLGKYFETRSKGRTGDAIRKLTDLAPKTASVEKEGGEIELPLEQVQVGDVVRVRPGGGIPVDGKVLSGLSAVDESAMTGESLPVEVQEGSQVRAGTINGNGSLRIEAQRVGGETTLSQIVKLVEEAGATKAPIARLADKIAGVFVPIVIGVALLAAAVWLALGQGFSFALNAMISVLVISCPCALGLATPVAVMVGTGRAASLGILFKNAEALEKTHAIKTVVLDKTGTLTEGKPQVTDVCERQPGLVELAQALEAPSGHPLSQAIVAYAEEQGVTGPEARDFEAAPGRGVSAWVDGMKCLGGNLAMMEENGVDVSALSEMAQSLSRQGKTAMYFARDGRLAGLIAVADVAKPDSRQAVEGFKRMGVDVVMLTGDNEVTARAVAAQMGIEHVVAGVLPQDKEKEVRRLQENGRVVAMVGDGVNDAPALTRADVGLAIGAGSDIAIESADVVLMKSSLMDAVNALGLSRAVMRNIKENLFWAFFYNAALIPLAAGVFFHQLGWALNPMLGAAAMSLSSVCVVSNALRLFRFKPQKAQMTTAASLPQKERAGGTDEQTTKKEGEKTMTKVLTVEGMMCGHCKMHVEKALSALEGVKGCQVNLENKTATVELAGEVSDEALGQAVADAGYQVTGIN